MFNRGAFNRMGFNQEYIIYVYASATLDGVGELTASGTMEFYPAVTLDGVGELQANAIRELYFSAQLDVVGGLTADAIRDRFGSAILDALGELTANGSRFRVEFIELTVAIAPGEKVIIDSKKMTVRKNGVVAPYTGDFFDLNTGDNVLTYTDVSGSRSAQIRVTHRDKDI